jgi:hypothetical protein
MCDVPTTSGGGSGGGRGAVVVAVILGGSVVAYLATPAATPEQAPAVATAPSDPGFPWLTASLSVLVGVALAGLVVLALRVRRRRREAVEREREARARQVVRRRVPQRAIEPPAQSAQAWLDRTR